MRRTALQVDCVTQINDGTQGYFLLLFTHKRYSSFQVGLTPLHLAAESGHKELVGLLVASYKASVDAFTLVRVCVLFLSIIFGRNWSRTCDFNLSVMFELRLMQTFCQQEKKTALHLAAEKGRLQVCEHLLELRADISALDNVSTFQHHYPSVRSRAKITFVHEGLFSVGCRKVLTYWMLSSKTYCYCIRPITTNVNYAMNRRKNIQPVQSAGNRATVAKRGKTCNRRQRWEIARKLSHEWLWLCFQLAQKRLVYSGWL